MKDQTSINSLTVLDSELTPPYFSASLLNYYYYSFMEHSKLLEVAKEDYLPSDKVRKDYDDF